MIDLVENEGECYIPMQTFNDLFMGQCYLQYVFNGKKLVGFSYGTDVSKELNDAKPEKMSEAFAEFNFNELCFMLDCNYGLKAEHDITSFASMILANPEIWEGLHSTDPNVFDKTLGRFIGMYIDDGHSAFRSPSWRYDMENEEDLTFFGVSFQNGISRIVGARRAEQSV